ncbi:MAG: hypothetical protein ACI81R_000361 [Bradymonadia bacterium]|jgi:hypothetical protein
MNSGFLQRTELTTLAVTAIAALLWASLGTFWGGASLAIGGLMAWGNFRALRVLVGRMMAQSAGGESTGAQQLAGLGLVAKMVLMMAAVVIVLWFANVDVVPFCVGLSLVFPSTLFCLLGGTRDIEVPDTAPVEQSGL